MHVLQVQSPSIHTLRLFRFSRLKGAVLQEIVGQLPNLCMLQYLHTKGNLSHAPHNMQQQHLAPTHHAIKSLPSLSSPPTPCPHQVAATPAAPLYNMAILPGRQNPPADEADEGEESSGFANLSGVLMIAPPKEAAVTESVWALVWF